MSLFLPLKLFVVIVFLIMFLRRPSVTWGIGLLTVTTAVLLDTLLGTFNRTELEAQLGFFYFVIAGALVGGAAVWVWGLLRPLTATETAVSAPPLRNPTPTAINTAEAFEESPTREEGDADGVFDRKLVYDEIRTRFGRGDVLDLIFDLGLNETEVMRLDGNLDAAILNIMQVAEARGQTGALALAVERILTPLPSEHLPRLDKITPDSPPTVLRQYLLAHYSLADLQDATAALNIDWERIGGDNKTDKVRNLLLYLYRRGRIEELVAWMHARES